MLAVVSPAKKLDMEPLPRAIEATLPVLLEETERLIKTTRRLRAKDLKALMGISDKLAELNHARFQTFSTPFDTENAKPAAFTFNGDVYLGLNAASLEDGDLEWAQDHLAILSGLYGLLRPMDLIQPYRLEMGTRLKTRRGKDLYAFWGDRITKRIQAQLGEHADPTLVNLASKEYFNAVNPKRLPGPVVTPAFKEVRDGKARMLSFFAKRARGLMARYMVRHRIDRPEGLKDFDVDGYRYDPSLSTDTMWTFTRPQPPPAGQS
jgi:cytoplasmic iron level regulating protein YaaA (DUF328/UPF0246 family)